MSDEHDTTGRLQRDVPEPFGIEAIVSDAAQFGTVSPGSGELTREALEEAIRAAYEWTAAQGEPPPAAWHGRRETMDRLLLDLGAARAENGRPLPVMLGTLSISLIHDEDVVPSMVIERAADGTILRGFACTDDGQWYCIAGEYVIPPLSWGRQSFWRQP